MKRFPSPRRSDAGAYARLSRTLGVFTALLAVFMVCCIGFAVVRRVSLAADSRSAAPVAGSLSVAAVPQAELTGAPTLSVLGDSISAVPSDPYGAVRPVLPAAGEESIWWQAAAHALSMDVLRVSAVAGSSTGRDLPELPGSAAFTRAGDLAADGVSPDVIVVYMGTNDTSEAFVPFGSTAETAGKTFVLDGTDIPATFADAYTLTLRRARAMYPDAQIFCCTVLFCATRPGVDTVNSIIRETAAAEGCTLIDLYAVSGVNADTQYAMLPDGVHPSAETARALGQCVASAVAEARAA